MVLLKKEEKHMEIYSWSRIRRMRQRIGGRTRRNQANGKPYDLYSRVTVLTLVGLRFL
jgi:hypothetical protein